MTILHLKQLLETKLDIEFTTPPKIELGILTTNEGFKRASANSSKPIEEAKNIESNINNLFVENSCTNLFFTKVMGGYVNIFPQVEFLRESVIDGIRREGIPTLLTTDKKIVLEFFQLNASKRPHIGHIRGGNIGEALRRILLLKHQNVIVDRHLGDWGVQFGLVVWGILNAKEYNLITIDFESDNQSRIIEDLETLYVQVNSLIDDKPHIRKEAQTLCTHLEKNFLEDNDPILALWHSIVFYSIKNLDTTAQQLNLNKKGFWENENSSIQFQNYIQNQRKKGEGLSLPNNPELEKEVSKNWSDETHNLLNNKKGVWICNQYHEDCSHDIDLGESFLFGYFVQEIDKWAEAGIIMKEKTEMGYKYFVDFEDQNLGRAHLISSDGYSTYIFRDVVTRFVWGGLFEADYMLSCVDSRQSHSLNQSFAIINRILDSGYYEDKPFPLLSQAQTLVSISKLKANPPLHIKNGYLVLTTGAMGSRKGNVFHFETLLSSLEESVKKTLIEKEYSTVDNSKIRTIAIASLKWAELHKDRESDITFDVDLVTKFEGNTGVYQLYTYARLRTILSKFDSSHDTTFDPLSFDINVLNKAEQELLQSTYLLPFVLESVVETYKPHLLCTYIFNLTSLINKWYSANSVLKEQDKERQKSLLCFVNYLSLHLRRSIELLGIDVVEQL